MARAFVIADIDVTDAAGYEDYKRLSSAAAQKYGGRFIVRGGEATVLEGPWSPHRVVVLEFDSEQAAREWWDSPEYAEARAIRQQCADSSLILVRGAD